MATKVRSENAPAYTVGTNSDDQIIAQAIAILERRLKARRAGNDINIDNFDSAATYCKLQFAAADREHFSVLFLDTRHRLIACETLSSGTLDSASVYPREVVRAAMRHNAAAIILTHNHPSGITASSRADIQITTRIVDACKFVGVRVLDHIIVGEGASTSLAALGHM